ncbi:MAG: 5-formyltetrahydrofolate cyclo-ligase [Pseudomonadota bacterium]
MALHPHHPSAIISLMQTTDSRQQLRTELRARRRALTPDQQAQASQWLLRKLMSLPLFMRSQHVALYWAMDGEIDVAPVATQLWKMGKHCYLPVLHPQHKRQLWFAEYLPSTQLKLNKFKIPEPDHRNAQKLPAHLLDVVLVPLVGFDATGARLGMGGGFYDTTFAFKQKQKSISKPWLLGVAHACQQMDKLETAEWDVALHGVVTDEAIFLCAK